MIKRKRKVANKKQKEGAIRKGRMIKKEAYKDFTDRFKLLIGKNPLLIITTLRNISTMRLIGNKTHGDPAEIAIAEFINQYMHDFKSVHVGKDLYRAKTREEDIKIINEVTKTEFPVSLKAYGDGQLQLPTDKEFRMFPRLEKELSTIKGQDKIQRLFADTVFAEFKNINVLPLIYDEKKRSTMSWFSITSAQWTQQYGLLA